MADQQAGTKQFKTSCKVAAVKVAAEKVNNENGRVYSSDIHKATKAAVESAERNS